MEDLLAQACRRLHFSNHLVTQAKKIKAKNHLDFLLQLFNEELEERDRKRRNAYQKAAKFDLIKTFEDYTFDDIKFPPALSPDDILNTAFIPKRENLILYGNVGAGKTHLATALGVAACDLGYRTRFWRTAALVNALIEAKRQGVLSKFMKQFDKLDLLICDSGGMSRLILMAQSCFSGLFRNVMNENHSLSQPTWNLPVGMTSSPTQKSPPHCLTVSFITRTS